MTTSIPTAAALALAWLVTSPAWASPHGTDGLAIAGVTASSTRTGEAPAGHEPSNLADGDPDTWWQPAGRSPRFAWVRLELAAPARVDGLVIANGVLAHADAGGDFSTLGRLRSAWVLFDDGAAEVIRLDPQRRSPRWVILARAHTTRAVTLVIRDVERGERWNHLAISEVSITGRPDAEATAGRSSLPPSPDPCSSPGWLPLRDAVVAYCGDPDTASRCEDPLLDVVLGCRADPGHPLPALDLTPTDKSGTARWAWRGRWFSVQVDLQRIGDRWRATDVKATERDPAD
ncbi:MAG: hypothetical protein CVU56_25640 [Deltaproteobacteria bacterium HGW-Deltaproteobacteria-14]|jgi:hypothetical protein|nr:MAG: hypothetical protein CVU56_25640 [Deltaproteobacteria bacterium HGW-Deltaproteobacteria-14]